jgi:hypothetical protein
MKEAYAVRRTVPPSAEIEARIEQLLSVGVGGSPRETLSECRRRWKTHPPSPVENAPLLRAVAGRPGVG